MSTNDNDFFGGLFDFNGDGHTDLGEEWIAFQILNESSENYKPSKTSTPIKPHENSLIPDTPPVINTKQELKKYKKECITSLIIATIVSIFFMIFPCAVIWAAIVSYDSSNSASGFVTIVFILGGLLLIGILISILVKEFITYHEQISIIQDRINTIK